jgi:hypothetical protein
VITLFPSESLVPAGWYAYDAIGHAPSWWNTPPAREHQPTTAQRDTAKSQPAPARRKRAASAAAEDSAALFGVSEVAAPAEASSGSLGTQVVASPRMATQRQSVRRAPSDAGVAALIDALTRAGGRLTTAEAAAAAGESPLRMSGYLALVTRLLNVDGYAVLQTKDDGRTVELNQQLLRQQFLGG